MLLFVRLFSSGAKYKVVTPNKLKVTLRFVFGKYLFFTNTLTCGLMMAGGDVIQQEIEKYGTMQKNTGYDWMRTGRMFAVGLAQGPPQHLFYSLLDRYIPGRALRTITIKIVLDQLIASPACIAIFFCGMGVMEGRPLEGNLREMKDKFLTVYMVDWLVWPPTQFINFYFLPSKYRVTYINFVTMLYDVFLSYVHHDVE